MVRWYTEMQALPDINFSFLTKPISNTSANELKTPAGWPKPEFKCVLREINIDLCFYGGYDFNTNKGQCIMFLFHFVVVVAVIFVSIVQNDQGTLRKSRTLIQL